MASDAKATAKPEDARVLSTEPLTVVTRINYKDALGKERDWESAERTTRHKDSLIDAVGVIAVFEDLKGPQILLQKQFRPPVGKVCIEIPAGLLDAGESGEECAVRELREETGYVGKAVKVAGEPSGAQGAKGVLFNDPGFTNTNLVLVHVDIDPSLPENKPENRKTELEESEFITTFMLPLKDLWGECRKLEAEGYAIDARVATIAEGIELAKKWKIGS
ncbi:MAG: hypothetical protein LQ340_000256 [Diploschistes diacapsis]|nr:MAG: hypothetical protein LQ340_000256 [Diploschistes diacapsis]